VVALAEKRAADAETALRPATARCENPAPDAPAIDHRCQNVEQLRARVELALRRPDAARRALDLALRSARATGTMSLETDLLRTANEVTAARDASRAAVAQAYLDEWSRRTGAPVDR